MTNQKVQLLYAWAENIQRAVQYRKFGKIRQQLTIGVVTGPRVGGLDIYAAEDPAGLKRAFAEAEGLNLATTVPWTFTDNHVNIFSHGKLIRVEAPWPEALAETQIPLRDINGALAGKFLDGWIAGTDENGHLIVPSFGLESHWLISGQTGGGKSVAMTSAIGQMTMAGAGKVKFVLIDGKHGESLSSLARCPNLIGPLVYDLPGATQALNWIVSEMGRRYAAMREMSTDQRLEWTRNTSRVVVVIDEIQTISADPNLAAMIALLLQQGRASKINLIISTQYPLNSMLGDSSMKQNLGGRVALKVNSLDASRVVLGTTEPDATKLLGSGDSYILAGGSFARVQIAYMTKRELAQLPALPREMDEWPETTETVNPLTVESGRASLGAEEIAQAILAAKHGEGRPALQSRLQAVGKPINNTLKLRQLLQLGKDIYAQIADQK